MTEEVVIKGGCIPLKTYCAAFGESLDVVNKRIQRGVWQKGVHYHAVKNVRGRWVDLDAISKWIRENSK